MSTCELTSSPMLVQDEKKVRLNVVGLRKGSYVGPEVLEGIFGYDRDSKEYQLALLGLYSDAQKQLVDTDFVVVTRHHGLLIMSDDEAVDYLQSRFAGGIRQAVRAYEKNAMISPDNLNAEQRKVHERRLINQSRLVQAIRK